MRLLLRASTFTSCGALHLQVVWKSTTQVGCGIKTCTTNSPFSGFPQWTIVVW